uniref:Uncharacterized protein n=1 Tax=Oryza meridionalis TaxID=40149 RepID=A0A0E0CFH1_9ORYZ
MTGAWRRWLATVVADGGGWTVVADGGGWRRWWLWRWRWRLVTVVAVAMAGWQGHYPGLTVRRRRRRHVEAGKESGGGEGGVRVRARRRRREELWAVALADSLKGQWNRGRKPCRAVWPADDGNAVWCRSPPWRRRFSKPLSFPYHILQVKTLFGSERAVARRVLLGGTALEKPLRARILSMVYALASNFSPRL